MFRYENSEESEQLMGVVKRGLFPVLFLTLLLLWGGRNSSFAQTVEFEVTNTCMANPECEGDGVTFSDPVTDAVAWLWDLGDGTTADTRNVVHSYTTPGPKMIFFQRFFQNGTVETISKEIDIGVLPPDFNNWKTDSTICPGDTITLDPYDGGQAPDGATFLWYPNGETTQTLKVFESGCYSVEVIMPNKCSIQNLINVKLCLEPAGDQGAKWFFGNGAGLDFQGGSPTPIRGELNTKEGTSVISNSKGELLFYSDGITIYNADHQKMPCLDEPCEDLRGSQESTQSVLIVPQPTCRGCEYLYNVFTTTSISATEKVLSVSVVDMRQEEGKGAIVELNRVLHNNTTERLVSSRNDQDTTYWTLSHDYASNTFRIFHATAGGLVEVDTFEGGRSHDTENQGEGQMKFSAADSTGQRSLAVVIPGPDRNYVDLFGFNDQDGTMSHTRTLDLGESPPTAYGVEFSTDRTKLYVSFMGNDTTASKLVQYDLSAADDDLIVSSGMTVDSVQNLKFGSLQLAPDGKIYMAIEGQSYLAAIGEPNDSTRIVSRLQYEREAIRLQGTSQLGLPNFVQNFTMPSDGAGFSAEGFCVDEPTMFSAAPLCDPMKNTYTWDFGDGIGFLTTEEAETSYTYTAPGTYSVTLTTVIGTCTTVVSTQDVVIYDVPKESGLEPYIEICSNEHVLEPTTTAANYVWVDLRLRRVVSRERTLTVYPPGGDFVIFMWNDPDALCLFSDTINVVMRRPPDLNIGPDLVMCEDSSVTLEASGQVWREFLWSNGETTREITVRQPGTYWVQTKDANDCVNRDTLQVEQIPKPAISLPGVYAMCMDNPAASVVLNPGGRPEYTYQWPDIPATTPQVTVTNPGTYRLLVSNAEGCTIEAVTEVQDKCDPRLVIPTAFSPDSNGLNDVLEMIGVHLTDFDFRVYNRWGEVVFASTNLDNKWDATYRGAKVQPGVYAWVATYKSADYPERPRYTDRGSVTVIR